eukprot:Nk52_evm3s526 gene=Nk52_evmTU3s526
MFSQPVQPGAICTSPLLVIRPRDKADILLEQGKGQHGGETGGAENVDGKTRPGGGVSYQNKTRLGESVYKIGFSYPKGANSTMMKPSRTSSLPAALYEGNEEYSTRASSSKKHPHHNRSAGDGNGPTRRQSSPSVLNRSSASPTSSNGFWMLSKVFKGSTDASVFHHLSKLSQENSNLRRDRDALSSAVDFYINRDIEGGRYESNPFFHIEEGKDADGSTHNVVKYHKSKIRSASAAGHRKVAGTPSTGNGHPSQPHAPRPKSSHAVLSRNRVASASPASSRRRASASSAKSGRASASARSSQVGGIQDSLRNNESSQSYHEAGHVDIGEELGGEGRFARCQLNEETARVHVESLEREGYLSAETIGNYEEYGQKRNAHIFGVLSIVVVDPDPYHLQEAGNLLTSQGHHVRTFPTLPEAEDYVADETTRGRLDALLVSAAASGAAESTSGDVSVELNTLRKEFKLWGLPIFALIDEQKAKDISLLSKQFSAGANGVLTKPMRFTVVETFAHEVYRARKSVRVYNQNMFETKRRRSIATFLGNSRVLGESMASNLGRDFTVLNQNTANAKVRCAKSELEELLKQPGLTGEKGSPLRNGLQHIFELLQASLEVPQEERHKQAETIRNTMKKVSEIEPNQTGEPRITRRFFSIPGSSSLGDNPDTLRQALCRKEFDQWQFNDAELLYFTEMILTDYNVLGELNVVPDQLRSFVLDMNSCYMDNAYHNFRHGFDTMQTLYCFLKECGCDRLFDTTTRFSLLIAAYSHDARHPGIANPFLIASRHPLAVLYNDKSVLENYHCSTTFQILGKKQSNILSGFTDEQRTIFKRNVISTIISTDLSLHGEVMTKFGQLFDEDYFTKLFDGANTEAETETEVEKEAEANTNADAATASSSPGSLGASMSTEQSLCLMNMLIKAADISNPAKCFSISNVWAELIQEEMLNQGDLERAFGLPISPHADRTINTREKSAHLSVKFISYLAMPLFTRIKVAWNSNSQFFMGNLCSNLERYTAMAGSEIPPPPSPPPAVNEDADESEVKASTSESEETAEKNERDEDAGGSVEEGEGDAGGKEKDEEDGRLGTEEGAVMDAEKEEKKSDKEGVVEEHEQTKDPDEAKEDVKEKGS